jgi:hypothetical protein
MTVVPLPVLAVFGPASRQRPRDMRVVVAGRSRSTGRTVRRGADGYGGRNGESRVHDQTLRESPAGARAARATLRRGEGCGHGPTGCREPLPHLRPPQRRRCSPVCIPSPLARIFYGRGPGVNEPTSSRRPRRGQAFPREAAERWLGTDASSSASSISPKWDGRVPIALNRREEW